MKTTKASPLRGALSHGVSQKSKSLEASRPPTPQGLFRLPEMTVKGQVKKPVGISGM